jgi:hypothetical protein
MTMIHHFARARPAAALLLACAASFTLGGCATAAPGRQAATAWHAGFDGDLRACQNAQGSRLPQRRRLEASHPRVAACLRLRGWNPDGNPSLSRMLSPG